ncbi:hypothetical protein [Leptolyngbya sp. FACHB-711]|uniref:hypothetical protein n=1 Tax=unclassified Leptolyngbya TaxID=2650499 RepID=UPI001687743A|nr:hypothetical protein [Leptolyngbya sp. FACHB-711]MBD1853890.1 hypothetical protein [Cyanobacteria bacterium FACHB-502]MBD2024325.1 hypothetical protein [Leptolyngbya sp. FACHB-711]
MSAIVHSEALRPRWRTMVLAVLAFWLSASLLLDLVIMPMLSMAGMLTEPGFAAAGYSIFWVFNHLELFMAALVLTGMLVLRTISTHFQHRWAIPAALALLAIVCCYTYGLTPEMSALGLQLNWFESTPAFSGAMVQMQGVYWLLEVCKLAIGAMLLSWCYQSVTES